MEILTNQKLANYVTIKLGGPAKELAVITNEQQAAEAAIYAKNKGLKIITLGKGSNSIFKDEGFEGLVIVNQIPGLTIDKDGIVKASGGVLWDEVVKQSVELGFCGIEAMSHIPGTAGAAPVNNIGAYGQELSEVLVSLRAYDCQQEDFVEIKNQDCNFGYRYSRFKDQDHGRFIICQIILQLKPYNPQTYQAPNYPTLINELNSQNITNPTPNDIRQAVTKVRSERLPNTNDYSNCGSFFKNPVVSVQKIKELLDLYPKIPHYPQDNDKEKLAASWLIDQAGLKNYRQNGCWVYDKQALVLINESTTSFKDLWAVAQYIIDTVNQKFGVILEPEPEIF